MDILTLNLAVKKALAELGIKEETTQTAVLAETNVNADNCNTAYGINGCFILPEIAFEAGKKYKVAIDDTVAIYEPPNTEIIHIIGNMYLLDGVSENTGEPYLLMSDKMNRHIAAVAFADPAENEKPHKVAVYEVSETIHPIDPKFMPALEIHLSNMGLPAGTTDADFFSGEGMPLYETEAHRQIMLKLMDAGEKGIPVIIHGFPTSAEFAGGMSTDGMTAIYKLERTCVKIADADSSIYQFAGFALIGSTFYIATLTLIMGQLIAVRSAVM